MTVYEIAGLFYETVGPALALCSRERPFSDMALSQMSAEARRDAVDDLVARLRKLDTECVRRLEPATERFIEFVKRIQANPRHAGAQIHLIAHLPDRGACVSPAAQAYVGDQECIELHYVPWNRCGRQWANLAERWLRVTAAWPMQTSFVETLFALGSLLRGIPQGKHSDTLVSG